MQRSASHCNAVNLQMGKAPSGGKGALAARQEGLVVTSTALLTASPGCLVTDVSLMLPVGRSFPQIPTLHLSSGVLLLSLSQAQGSLQRSASPRGAARGEGPRGGAEVKGCSHSQLSWLQMCTQRRWALPAVAGVLHFRAASLQAVIPKFLTICVCSMERPGLC